MNNRSGFVIVCILLLIASGLGSAGYIVDSGLTREEALEGLDPRCPDSIQENQRLVRVDYYSTDGRMHRGQIMVDYRLADDLKEVFHKAYAAKFPIERVTPVSRYGWDDEQSMQANNTSGFNYRETTGGKKLSNHAYGFAVDINPRLNPYIKDGVVLPPGAVYDPIIPGTLTADHVVVQTFLQLGWTWGGNWETPKDYQHFEKIPQ